jgi:LPS-assembly protein
MKRFVGLLLISLLPFFTPLNAPGQSVDTALDGLNLEDSELPVTLDADVIRYDDATQQYVAEGNVVIQRADLELRADTVRFDYSSMQVIASGNIQVRAGEDVLAGSRLELDLARRTGTLTGGYLFLKQNNYIINGEKIQKTGENTYRIENASVTTCDGDPPDWLISGKTVKVTVEGYGVIKGATLRARNVPILYLPYMVFPAKTKRQTGLLFPELGSSDRWGYFINQPFFWAIGEHSDATAYYHLMGKRGHKFGGEYRYYITQDAGGAWQADYFKDRKVDDGTGDSSKKWGYTDDDNLRPDDKRYWFRGGHYQPLPLDFKSRLELDWVSDQDYLVEFKEGYSGYDNTNDYFLRTFQRQIDDYTNIFRLNRFDLNRTWNKFNLDVDFRWFENAAREAVGGTDDTLQRLPRVDFTAARQHLLGSFLYFDLDTSYNYFYREEGDRGHRLDIYPRLYLPFRLGRFAGIEPSVGLRETLWYVDPEEDAALGAAEDNRFNRQFYDFRLDLNSEFYGLFPLESRPFGIDRIKHTVVPRITYEYVPEQNQNDLPAFDALDRIDSRNRVTCSLTNFLFTRKLRRPAPADGPAAVPDYRSHQAARFKLEQSYDIDEARADDLPPGTPQEPFSPLTAELDIWLNSFLHFDSDAAWDVYDHRFQSGNLALTVTGGEEDRLYLGYRFTRDATESFLADLFYNINQSFAVGLEYERNFETDQRLKAAASIRYRSQCWGVSVRYLQEPSDRKIEFAINLIGLGEAGGSF